MELKEFEEFISLINKADERNSLLYDAGIDTLEYSDIYHSIISKLGEKVFGSDGWDWVSYYLYEIPLFKEGKDFYATRKDGSPIYLRNSEELYTFLKEEGHV
jgi:hypothetical protein